MWEREEVDEDGDGHEDGDLTGDMTRDRDVRTVTGGGDFTGDLPFVADILIQDERQQQDNRNSRRPNDEGWGRVADTDDPDHRVTHDSFAALIVHRTVRWGRKQLLLHDEEAIGSWIRCSVQQE